jgi:hypothetical protein
MTTSTAYKSSAERLLMFSFCSLTAARTKHMGEARIRRPVSRVLSPPPQRRRMAIPLGRPLPGASRDLPGRPARKPACPRGGRRPYLVLLPVGFAVPSPLPATRCALTAPFHPDPQARVRAPAGGLLSVALSLGSPPPGVTRHRVSVEPGLSSPVGTRRRCPGAAIRPPDPCRMSRRSGAVSSLAWPA